MRNTAPSLFEPRISDDTHSMGLETRLETLKSRTLAVVRAAGVGDESSVLELPERNMERVTRRSDCGLGLGLATAPCIESEALTTSESACWNSCGSSLLWSVPTSSARSSSSMSSPHVARTASLTLSSEHRGSEGEEGGRARDDDKEDISGATRQRGRYD